MFLHLNQAECEIIKHCRVAVIADNDRCSHAKFFFLGQSQVIGSWEYQIKRRENKVTEIYFNCSITLETSISGNEAPSNRVCGSKHAMRRASLGHFYRKCLICFFFFTLVTRKKKIVITRVRCVIGWCAYDISTFYIRFVYQDLHFELPKKKNNATSVC